MREPKPKIAAAYIRVSSDDQLEYSPDSQLKLIREYAQKNGYVIDEDHIYADDGISAKTAKKRDAFNEMIAAAKTDPKPFDVILVWKFSRFARNQEQSIVYKSLLARRGIEVKSISEPIIDGPFGSLIERIIEWMDEYYLINLSGEVKRGMEEAVTRGKPVYHPPIGYDMKDGNFVVNEESAEVVREIYRSYLGGEGIRAIAVRLGNRGVRSIHGNPPDNRMIEYILRNPAYIGKIRWSNEGRASSRRDFDNPNIITVDGSHEAIIDMETWNAAQNKLDNQKKSYQKYQRKDQPVQFMLKGLVRCSSCGATLVYIGGKCPTMQCHNYGKGKCKISHSISISKANNAIIEELEKTSCLKEIHFSQHNYKHEDADWDRLIELEKKKLAKIKKAYQEGIDTLEEYKESKGQILKKIDEYEKENTKQNYKKIDSKQYAERIKETLEVVKNPDIDEKVKNLALRSIISDIVYDKSMGAFIINYYA